MGDVLTKEEREFVAVIRDDNRASVAIAVEIIDRLAAEVERLRAVALTADEMFALKFVGCSSVHTETVRKLAARLEPHALYAIKHDETPNSSGKEGA